MHRRDLATAVRDRIVERELHDTRRAHHADVLDRDRRIFADLRVRFLFDDGADPGELGRIEVELDAGVQVFDVLADDDEIDVAHRGLDPGIRLRGAQVGVEVELLAQRDVHRPHSGPELRRERTL